ncbi:MAG TPA: Crp/Fnr family transcriptional regulator [Candidatus Marinimicrobia bacterium]|nr:MAG: Crp/Fnr family transcriptional regulator [Candidatus Marinimicrobia bacterium CG1_02_48_14]PIZ65536.1 MAG: Crp/Fnr family transcriptional regulator [Candidatus Marinimicrobia bacterium CG_4_10_14_0_2_um_filter_48_9]PJA51499.1 MAG: Crp/Fnr family transcriptional regulator [Candidatus Marinimicrobia bacterium CG_4_9_14_3_um_filter_48_9]HCW77105.1 Crp/Fnr family transcriptional regulator [Candidatus Neomarinimicrobiota bacterium]
MDLNNFKIQIRKITDFSENECALFLPYLNRRLLKKHEHLLKEGQSVNSIAFVEKGNLRLYYLSDGKEINNHFFLEGDYAVSYLDFLKQRPSRYFIQALEDCELLTFDSQSLQAAYDQSKNWERFGRIIAESAYATATNRFESFLFLSARDRYLQMQKDYPRFIQRIPLFHLASYLGIEPESLSRIRKEISTKSAKY